LMQLLRTSGLSSGAEKCLQIRSWTPAPTFFH
jgi:hypothetical protein